MIDNAPLQDRGLSLKARGLLVTMAGLPPNWRFSVTGLAAICKDGRDSVRSALRELEERGYLRRRSQRDTDGQLQSARYEIDC